MYGCSAVNYVSEDHPLNYVGSTATDKARNTCLLHRARYFIWQLSFGVSHRYSPTGVGVE
jgi:hypothetical protein